MPGQTTLDELVVKVGLDPSGFRQGQQQVGDALKKTRDEAVARTRDIEDAGKRAASWFTTLRKEVIGLFGVLLGAQGFKDFIMQTARSEQAMGNLSAVIGMSVSQLYLWGETAKRYGGTAEGFAQSLRGMAVAISQFQLTGQSNPTTEWLFRMFGADAAGMINRIHEVGIQSADLFKIIEKLQKLNPADQAAAGGALGFSPADMNMLRQGISEILIMQEKIRKHDLMTEEDVKRGTEFNQALLSAQQAMTMLGLTILRDVEPQITWVLDHFTSWIDALRENKDMVHDIATALEVLAGGAALKALATLFGVRGVVRGLLGAAAGGAVAGGAAAAGSGVALGSFGLGASAAGYNVAEMLLLLSRVGGVASFLGGMWPSTANPDEPRPGDPNYLEGWGPRSSPPAPPRPPIVHGPVEQPAPGLGSPGGEPWDLPHRRARGGSPVTDVVSLLREGLVTKGWQQQAGLWGTSGATPRGTRGDPLFIQPARDLGDVDQTVAQQQLSRWGWWGSYQRWPSRGGRSGGSVSEMPPSTQAPFPPAGPSLPWRPFTSAQGETSNWLIEQAQKALGLTAEQAAGIAGNVKQESGFNPTIQSSAGAIGLFQHWGSRRTGLESWAKQQGLNPYTKEAEWGFALHELQTTSLGQETIRRLREARTPAEAAKAWALFEAGSEERLQRILRGTPGTDAYGRRAEFAEQALRHYRGRPAPVDPGMTQATRAGANMTMHQHAPVDNSSSVETHVGTVNVHTQATDAQGIASGIGAALKRYIHVSQANYGLA